MKIAAVILGLLLAGSIIAAGQAAAYPDLQSHSKISSYLSNRNTTASYLESLMERTAGDTPAGGSGMLPVPTISTMDSSKINGILRQRAIRLYHRTYTGPTLSEEEATRIAISAMEQSFRCDTDFTVTSARLGSSAPAYATMNPCWYVTLEGRYTNLAGCEICTAYPDQDGRTMYGCPCPSGIVVLDAVSGKVQMVDHSMCYGHYFENGEFAPLFVEN